jgi:transmembrane sensor
MSEEALDQAATWIARLRSDDTTAEDKRAFAIWFAAARENRQAYDQTFSLWQDLEVVRELPFDDVTSRTGLLTRLNPFQFNPLPLAAAAVLVVSVVASMLIYTTPTYQTEVGEQSTFTLADGSTLNLNTDTAVNIDFSTDERAIDLISGEAFFEVKQDPSRPFVISACQSTIVAVGTAFNVLCADGNMTVTVSEGKVKVTGPGIDRILYTAEQVIVDDAGGLPVRKVNTDNVTAWRKQLHIYDGVPLSAVVADLNRYNRQKIRILDSDLGKIEVVARYRMTGRESTLSSLEKTFPLRVVTISDDEIALIPIE